MCKTSTALEKVILLLTLYHAANRLPTLDSMIIIGCIVVIEELHLDEKPPLETSVIISNRYYRHFAAAGNKKGRACVTFRQN